MKILLASCVLLMSLCSFAADLPQKTNAGALAKPLLPNIPPLDLAGMRGASSRSIQVTSNHSSGRSMAGSSDTSYKTNSNTGSTKSSLGRSSAGVVDVTASTAVSIASTPNAVAAAHAKISITAEMQPDVIGDDDDPTSITMASQRRSRLSRCALYCYLKCCWCVCCCCCCCKRKPIPAVAISPEKNGGPEKGGARVRSYQHSHSPSAVQMPKTPTSKSKSKSDERAAAAHLASVDSTDSTTSGAGDDRRGQPNIVCGDAALRRPSLASIAGDSPVAATGQTVPSKKRRGSIIDTSEL